MRLTFDDQAVIDNLERVTLTSVRLTGNRTATEPLATVDDATAREAAPSGGVYVAADYQVTVRTASAAALGGVKPGDRITRADGTVLTVLAATGGGLSAHWNLNCRNLILAADLRQTCDVLRPAVARDAAGFRTPTFAAVYEDVPCRLQERAAEPDAGDAAAGLRREFDLYVGERLYLQAQDTVEIDGETYDVAGSADFDRIDGLGLLRLRRTET